MKKWIRAALAAAAAIIIYKVFTAKDESFAKHEADLNVAKAA
jgi:hypothetical protein